MKGYGEKSKSKKKNNQKLQLTKEQIIIQAFKFHAQGNILEAAKYYQFFIDKGFKNHRVFLNHGVILKSLGELQSSELSFRKAIELNPNLAEGHSNLGIILKDLGNLKEAELSFRKAIEIKPDYALAYSNLGNVLRDNGKLKEAELSFRKAIEIKPDYALAYSNLGNVLRDNGKLKESFDSYLKVIDINPKISNIYESITRLLKESDISQLNKSKIKDVLNLLLERNDVTHGELIRAFNFLYNNQIIDILENIDSDFSKIELLINDKIIINALKKVTFKDIRIEKFLTKVRSNICDRITKDLDTINESELQFIIALGEQCFLNEYIYSLTKKEILSINKIIKRCKNIELNEINISILSCYFPLYKLIDKIPSLKSFSSPNKIFTELMELQISEPLQEIDLSQNIKKLGTINDEISQKVKSQYEENPYPRWRYGSYHENQKLSINQAINIEIKPNSIGSSIGEEQVEVLVAGCGTGQQILHTQVYKNAHTTAIDLSLSSLSYAQRKINELGINNVELIQMDILDISLLEKKFDIILCSGVLHHMADLSKGLSALVGALKNNGFLKLGLYSELARQDIIKARNYIDGKNLKPTITDIRRFREDVISGTYPEIENLQKRSSFYSTSECRDLCFNVQEHRLTINQLKETLNNNKLEFLGFLLEKPVKSLYKQYFPQDKKQNNLENWAKFEEKHPNTFRGMYQFWVSQKRKNTR